MCRKCKEGSITKNRNVFCVPVFSLPKKQAQSTLFHSLLLSFSNYAMHYQSVSRQKRQLFLKWCYDLAFLGSTVTGGFPSIFWKTKRWCVINYFPILCHTRVIRIYHHQKRGLMANCTVATAWPHNWSLSNYHHPYGWSNGMLFCLWHISEEVNSTPQSFPKWEPFWNSPYFNFYVGTTFLP